MSQSASCNEVYCTGILLKKIEKKTGGCMLLVRSESTYLSNKGSRKETITPFFYCSKEIPLPDELCEGAHISIHAHVYVYEWHEKGKKRIRNQYMRAETVSMEHTLLEEEFGIKGNTFPAPEFKIRLMGEVMKVLTMENGWENITVNTKKQEKDLNIQICRKTDLNDVQIKPGDIICALCQIKTKQKIVNESETKRFEDLIVQDISIL